MDISIQNQMILINITKTEKGTNAVSARDLHTGLESKQDFSTWIKKRLEDLGAIENIDYLLHKKKEQLESGAKHLTEYIITIDIAKHIAMMERNEKGKEYRQYFIDFEKKQAPQLPKNYIEALEALTKSEKEKLALSETVKEKDKVILAVADLNIRAGDVSIGDFAKNLAIQGLGQNNLFAWLKARGFLMMDTTPYQPYVERGYFVRKPYEEKVNGEVRYKTMLTAKGTVWLTKILKAEYNIEE